MPEVDEREPDAPTDPPIGWAQKSKVPPGMKDPDDQRPGFGLRVMGFAILVVALLLIVFGNWVVSQPGESFAGTSQGDALLGVAAFLVVVSFVFTLTGLIVGQRARGKGPTDD
jgi:hypothetical protein